MNEIERIKSGPEANEELPPLVLPLSMTCADSAALTLERIRDVLVTVLARGVERKPDTESWRHILPNWFVESCVPEMTAEEKTEFLKLTFEERLERGERWTLAGWLYWFQDSQRQWEWWDAIIQSPQELRITLAPQDDPFAHGAFDWLCRCAGASKITMGE